MTYECFNILDWVLTYDVCDFCSLSLDQTTNRFLVQSRIEPQIFYSTIRSLMSVMLGGLAPGSLYLGAFIWTLGQKKWTNLARMWYFSVDLYDLQLSWCLRNWILLLAVIFTLSHGFLIECGMCKSWELS